jgi:hypothetical protein
MAASAKRQRIEYHRRALVSDLEHTKKRATELERDIAILDAVLAANEKEEQAAAPPSAAQGAKSK